MDDAAPGSGAIDARVQGFHESALEPAPTPGQRAHRGERIPVDAALPGIGANSKESDDPMIG